MSAQYTVDCSLYHVSYAHPISELVAAVPVGDGDAAFEHEVAGYKVGELRVAGNRWIHVKDLRQRVLAT